MPSPDGLAKQGVGELIQELPPGCTGALVDGEILHDQDTCPIHEAGQGGSDDE